MSAFGNWLNLLDGPRTFATLAIGFGFLAVGIVGVGEFGHSAHGWWRTRKAEPVPGQVLSVAAGKSRGTLDARYRYSVGGMNYIGSEIALFKEDRLLRDKLESALRDGSTVSVFYDPAHPEFAILDRGLHWAPFVFLPWFFMIAIIALRRPPLRRLTLPRH